MRITQSMVMNSYTSRLGKVFESFDHASQQVITKRNFLSATEDPASTARAYQLRKNFQQNNDYINNVQDVIDTMDSIDASMMVISNMAESAHVTLTAGRNGVWSLEDRTIFANELRTMQRQAVDALNAKFDDKFLFGGSSTKTLPFELTTDTSTTPPKQVLTFRGLDITDPANQAKLQEFADEKIYVDMGFGLQVDYIDPSTGLAAAPGVDGVPVVKDSSAFNTSIPGIKFLGFGENPEDNLILNMGLIADELEKEPLDYDKTTELWEKLTGQRQQILNAVTKVGADYNFLQKQKSVLEVNSDNLNNKILNVEFMDMEVAINNLKMADYVYRSALEVGTKILTPSFIDFMS